MEVQSIAALIFLAVLTIILIIKKDKLQLQKIFFPFLYVAMYRTQVGIRFMDHLSKKSKGFWKWFGYAGIVIGFTGMVFICGYLLKSTYDLLFVPGTIPGVSVVQPISRSIPGTFFVPFFYWIISIFVLVIVHESAHGIMARRYDLRVKSSGLAFLGILIPIIPAAFVEPDEKKLFKKPRREQLSILAAGSFTNILLAVLIILFLGLVANPVLGSLIEGDGVLIQDITRGEDYPAENSGMSSGEIIVGIENISITNVRQFSSYMDNQTPGENITIITDNAEYDITLGSNPDNESLAYLGIFVEQYYSSGLEKGLLWIYMLLIFLYALNLGVGLFNLLPLPIADGGRMFYLALTKYLEKDKAEKIWKFTASFFLMIVLANLIFGFII